MSKRVGAVGGMVQLCGFDQPAATGRAPAAGVGELYEQETFVAVGGGQPRGKLLASAWQTVW